MLAKVSKPSMANTKLSANDITILKELVAMLSRTNTSVQDLEALLLARGESNLPDHTKMTLALLSSI